MNSARELFEICYLTFLVIYVLYCLFLYIHRIREKEYTSFGILASVYLVYFSLNSSFILGLGLQPDILAGLIMAFITLFPATLVNFIARTRKEVVGGLIRWAIYPWFGLAIIALTMPLMGRWEWDLFRLIWGGLALYSLAVLWWIVVRAHHEGFYESTQLTMGVTGITLGLLLVGAEQFKLVALPYYAEDLAVVFFAVTMKYGLIKRYARYVRDLHHLSGKILDAHEEERKRLARDIHDGIGQSLLAIKLNLQMMKADRQRAVTDEALTELVDETSAAIEELRRIAMNLRPAFLKRTSIAEILRWYALRYEEKTGLNIVIDADDTITTDIRTKDNLYRICQEALNNVLKHSGAAEVLVALKKDRDKIMLSVSDNGSGMNERQFRDADGIGISTMRERAELLGGIFHMETTPAGGTTIKVGVPL
ncbi:hypothetical protein C2E25_14670 [Geothermobacter hydrogeniphilus]|uniref:Oxygen sensor histidine kinase NreB n=1 Tax=Geothermobacter hydrogeniphilus TaxID=1969733 RepID=A0A2K2H724_9BACT|nr:sensor histidine kinase [Geothermobacter hydrogeniphilus]PNU19047.1 hypothetical protein C2E25_14670 [Geothermobacter hydrogeniphilus]